MPMHNAFAQDLLPILPQLLEVFLPPFHVLHERGIIEAAKNLQRTLSGADPRYRNYYAVKANSNPEVLQLLHQFGMGFDCSSAPELTLARDAGAKGEDIFFSSNNTTREEFAAALANGDCILNLDDIELVDKVPDPFPKLICFRYNPGAQRVLNSVIGNPETCKYGVPHEQIVEAYRLAKQKGAKRFGLHTMVVSNECDWQCHAETAAMLLNVAELLWRELDIRVELINIGGGLGIPYRPKEQPVDLPQLAAEIKQLLDAFAETHGWRPRLCSENGRYVLGPNGVFVAKCISEKHGYRKFRGVNASAMSSIMRPPMYHPNGGYHHITVLEEPLDEPKLVSVVGPACEDSDRFGWDRWLSLHEGQHVIVHDTGAHAIEMGNNYNNRPKPAVLILRVDGRVDLIQPAETNEELVSRRYRYREKPWSWTPNQG
ncbi:diaminopimelate decarboxylase [Candidatus Falkowbacteria bacterium]|nr:diaminopimelate decarboxylase [Candidatus Falkowbacteria bacterium]